MNESQEQFYQEIESWLVDIVCASPSRPFVLGVSSPQGSGKTTMSNALSQGFQARGMNALAISIDDFYLTRSGQEKLSGSSLNPYLQQRGYPGTHDIELGRKVIASLKQGLPIKIPRYDKSKFSGKGDRASEEFWTEVSERQDLIILEGWMLGFIPKKPDSFEDSCLKEINEYLELYSQWTTLLDGLLAMGTNELSNIVNWRIEAEAKMKASGKAGMGELEVRRYIESFIPAYQLYLEDSCRNMDRFKYFRAYTIGRDRSPLLE